MGEIIMQYSEEMNSRSRHMRSRSLFSCCVFSDTRSDVTGWIYVVWISISVVYCPELPIIRHSYMSPIRAVLLDFDGVMVHTMSLLYRFFSDKQGNVLLWNEQEYDASLLHFLLHCREHGLHLAIVSNSREEYIQNVLKKMHIQDYFVTSKKVSTVFGNEKRKISKSDPDSWIHCTDVLWVPPDQCMVVEDSISGIIGAKKWGIKSCYYHRFHSPDRESLFAADYHVDNFDDIIKLLA